MTETVQVTGSNKSLNSHRTSISEKYNIRIPKKSHVKLDPIDKDLPRYSPSIEVSKVLAAYQETIKKVEIVTALPYIMEQICRLRFPFGVDLTNAIERHYKIQIAYHEARSRVDLLLNTKRKLIEKMKLIREQMEAKADNVNEENVFFDFFSDSPFLYGEDEFDRDSEIKWDLEPSRLKLTEIELHQTKTTKKNSTTEEKLEEKPSFEEKPSSEEKPSAEHLNKPDTSSSDTPQMKTSAEKTTTKEEEALSGGSMDSDESHKLLVVDDAVHSGRLSNRSSTSSRASRYIELPEKNTISDIKLTISIYEPQIEEAVRHLGLIATTVCHSLKNILRLYIANPLAAKALENHKGIRSENCEALLELLHELGGLVKAQMMISPEEDTKNKEYLESILRRESITHKYIAMLEDELKKAAEEMDAELQQKKILIENLQVDHIQIESFSNEAIRRTLANSEKIEFNCAKNSEQRTKLVQKEIDALEEKHRAECKDNREVELELRNEKYKVENELENLIKRYDADMNDKTDEFQHLEIIYEEDKKVLAELEETFFNLEREYNGIMEERREQRIRKDWRIREEKRLHKNVCVIQSFWRAYIIRKIAKKDAKRRLKEAKRKAKELEEKEKQKAIEEEKALKRSSSTVQARLAKSSSSVAQGKVVNSTSST